MLAVGRSESFADERHQGKLLFSFSFPRSRELRTQKLKSHLVRTQSLKVLPLKPGVGQYIALHAPLSARDILAEN